MRMQHRFWPIFFLPLMLMRCQCETADNIAGLPGTIVGTLCDIRTGLGARNVEIAVSTDQGGSMRAESRGGGSARLENVPPGIYDVVISQSFADREDVRTVRGVEVKPDEETEIADPACIAGRNPPGTGWIRGRVCNRHTGSWVTAAEVVIVLPDGNLMVTNTDGEGNFLLEGVPEGEHVLTVRGSSFNRSYEVQVQSGRETALESPAQCVGVDANSGGVEGVLCAPNGTGPLTGATAWLEVGMPPVRLSDTTDALGAFIITGIPPGDYDLHVELGAYHRIYPVSIQANTITRIGPNECSEPNPNTTGRIAGHFCAPSGGPLIGASVTVDVSGGSLEDTTDAQGMFDFAGVDPGQHVVTVSHVSLNAQYPVTVVAGQVATVAPQGVCVPIVAGPTGEIRGRICAPNGTTWLANARVWVDGPNGPIETQTDANGRFTLTGVPAGTYTVHVQAGSFTTDIPGVAVQPGEITEVGDSEEQCVPIGDDHKIAVVSGDYDDIESVLRRLGLENIDTYTGEDGSYQLSLLEDYQLMQEYDVIFFNCGMDDAWLSSTFNSSIAVANVRQYVESGKSIYASDWAYDLVEVAWPGYVEFVGDDYTRDTAQLGEDAENSAARVVDPALRNALGQQDVLINYNLPGWAVMEGVGPETRVYIRGDAEVCTDYFFCTPTETVYNVPFTVGFHPSPNAGKVIYTSFHQEQQTTQDMDMILNLLVFEL